MSRSEVQVLLAGLRAAIDNLLDLQSSEALPQHVAEDTARNVRDIEEAARELRRLHNIGAIV